MDGVKEACANIRARIISHEIIVAKTGPIAHDAVKLMGEMKKIQGRMRTFKTMPAELCVHCRTAFSRGLAMEE